jgi:hypothetical protein
LASCLDERVSIACPDQASPRWLKRQPQLDSGARRSPQPSRAGLPNNADGWRTRRRSAVAQLAQPALEEPAFGLLFHERERVLV